MIAIGMPLLCASPGINGLNVFAFAETGISLSSRFTMPKGYPASKLAFANLGNPWLGAVLPSEPVYSGGGIGPISAFACFSPDAFSVKTIKQGARFGVTDP